MRVGQYLGVIERFYNDPKHMETPFLVVGPAGIGKTFIAEDSARRKGWDVYSLCMPLVNPTFLMGYPGRENGHADHYAFGVLDKALHATKDTVVNLDDLGAASSETGKSALRFLQFREVCGKRLPDCVRIIALTNDVGHGIGIEGFIEPLKNRFASIFNVEPHIDDTVVYGLANGWPAWLLAYLRNDPKGLHDLVPVKSMQQSGATPRGWESVAKLERAGYLDLDVGPELIQGAVGKGRGTAALAFRELVNELPDVDSCLLDPDSAPVPENPSARYLVSTALSAKMSAGNFGQAVRYLARLPQMFRAFSIRDAFQAENMRRKNGTLPKDHKPLSSSREFTSWTCSEDGKQVLAAAS